MPGVRLLLCAALTATVALGCEKLRASDPVTAYQSFIKALERADSRAAFGYLSSGTRKRLTEQAAAASQASGGALEAEPHALTFPLLGRPGNVTEVKVLRQEQDRAVLQITADGRAQELTLVREEGGWRIDA